MLELTYLNGFDVDALALTDEEILDAVRCVLAAHVDNHRLGLPSELALLLLMDPLTGVPAAILDATAITYSRQPESRDGFAARLGEQLDCEVRAVKTWEECVRGADVVVEASRLTAPSPLLRTEWISPGALVVPYGTVSAVELSLTDIMDKIGRRRLGRRSSSGTAASRLPTWHSARRCWPKPGRSGWVGSCPTGADPGKARASMSQRSGADHAPWTLHAPRAAAR